ncbi:hypothetical protein K9N08_03190 [Candidatus Gracilibacteria bacterium]|nr:hypothetical protein [Candidatus Gracilibacteria bacterium]MCF7856535.1 hypothetical protein [Candidatus Gracilibacteria bacterium]MCF7896858.1 hypothetical protein [Candidatus Gracilibacteria bacterium]
MVLVKVIGVVMVWRGVWELLDKYLFPGNYILSAITSIALGFFILYLPDGKIDSLLGLKKLIFRFGNYLKIGN